MPSRGRFALLKERGYIPRQFNARLLRTCMRSVVLAADRKPVASAACTVAIPEPFRF